MRRYAGTDATADRPQPPHSQSLDRARQSGEVNWLRPDSKSQVTVEFDGFTPVRIDTIVVSTQHCPEVEQKEIADYVRLIVAAPAGRTDQGRAEVAHQSDRQVRRRWSSRRLRSHRS
ncbi:MAG: hypothetical protein R3B96_04500 [Pirellulaceae bacterium]